MAAAEPAVEGKWGGKGGSCVDVMVLQELETDMLEQEKADGGQGR